MPRLINLLVLIVALGIALVGCQNGPVPTDSNNAQSNFLAPGKITLPEGAVFESATFHVYVSQAANSMVTFHKITDMWDEDVVTWNSFGGAFDATVEASFTSDATGWYAVDVTDLVAGWLDGSYDNYGMLLTHADLGYPRTVMHSSENASDNPYLEICYSVDGSPTCVTDGPIGDTYIWELSPDENFGYSIHLQAGWAGSAGAELEKQTLIQFDLEMVEPQPAAIGDYVWIDQNKDGIQDEGEPGMPDVTVHLMDCYGQILATTTTDADGLYLFSDLMPGDYNIRFVLPEAYVFTMQDQGGDDAMDSDADPSTGLTVCTTLESGETDLTWDAGLYLREMEGCTLTIGFWKNHAGFGPQDDVLSQYLPIMLGDWEITDAQTAYDILTQKVYGHPSNGITKLYAQMLAAKLNMEAGADGSDIADEISDADEFLSEYDWTDWDDLSKKTQKMVNKLKSTFDNYNNGYIGPGHCDDM